MARATSIVVFLLGVGASGLWLLHGLDAPSSRRTGVPAETPTDDARAVHVAEDVARALELDADRGTNIRTQAELREFMRWCEFAGPESLGRLRTLALHGEDSAVRGHAVRALGRLANGHADPAIVELVRDASPAVRHAAIAALGESDDGTVLHQLEEQLDHRDATARRLAAVAIAKIGGPRADALLEGREASEEGRELLAFARAARARGRGSAAPSTRRPSSADARRDR